MGSLGFGTFGIVRVWVLELLLLLFFFFENLVWVPVWVRCHSYFSMICSSLFFFFFGDFCVSICDFERGKFKSKIFVFEFVLGSVFVFVILKGKIKNLKFLCLCLGFWWLLWSD